ncbi:MAG: elongation factor P [Desulfovibrionaceae bacterium]
MFSTTDFRRGLKIEYEDAPWEIVEFQHFKPGKGGAIVRTKLKNMLNGKIVDKNFRSGEKVGKPDMEVREMQFLYHEGDGYAFMDLTTYEQISVPEDCMGGKGGYLKDGQEVKILLYNGQPIDLDMAASVSLTVTQTEPGVKGDTVSSTYKPATLETGITIQVPLFIEEGEKIKVDTRSGEYLGRDK